MSETQFTGKYADLEGGGGDGYGKESDSLIGGAKEGGYDHYEDDSPFDGDSMSRSVKMGFLRKVYGLLFCQLLVNAVIVALFMGYQPARVFLYGGKGEIGPLTSSANTLMILSMVSSFAVIIGMSCTTAGFTHPWDKVLLGFFTVAESVLVGVACAGVEPNIVYEALGITAALVLALTLFTFQTKYDFISIGGGLYFGLWMMILVGMFSWFLPMSKPIYIVYLCCGIILFCGYIVYDTQMILSRGEAGMVDAPAMAALSLYLDILNLFLYIIQLLQVLRR